MKTQEAVVCRIKKLCDERNLKLSQLAYNAGNAGINIEKHYERQQQEYGNCDNQSNL